MAAIYATATAIEVATVAATALSLVATVQQQIQATANANVQEEAANKRNEQLVEQTVANYDELSAVELDAQQRMAEDSIAVQKDYLVQKGRTNLMAAAMGTAGQSISGQLQDLERTKYSNFNTVLLSRQAEQDNIKSQAETMRYQAASNMNVSPISRPSWASTALSVGSKALSGYTDYKNASKSSSGVKPVTVTADIESGV